VIEKWYDIFVFLCNKVNWLYIVKKENSGMNNGSKPSKLEISIDTFPYYSSYYEKARVSPVMRVNVGGFSENSRGNLEISIVGKCGETEFIHRHDFVREAFCPENYNYKTKDTCSFEYSFDMFSVNSLFLSSLEKETDAEIYVMVSFGEAVCCEKTIIRLLPRNMWQGLEYEPSALASFVMPEEEHIESICESVDIELYADYVKCDKKQLSEGIKAIYKALKSKSIIYSRPAGYGASSFQKIRLPEELFTGGSTLATPLEIALLFSSCAQRCGYDTEIIFGVGRTTEVQILCGIWRKRTAVTIPVCENKELLSDAIRYGELVVVEPSVFAAAQNTSFSLSCESARNMFLNQSFSLICSLDIRKSFEYGVSPLIGECHVNKDVVVKTVKKQFSALYTSLRSAPCMKYLSGEQSGRFPEIPLLCDFNDVYYNGERERTLVPLDLNVSLYEFAGIDKGFSSVVTSVRDAKKYSSTEKSLMQSRLEKIKSRVISDNRVMTVMNEEALYETSCKMVFGKDGAKPYIVFGYIRIYDKLTDTNNFAPLCFVPAKISYNSGSFCFCQDGKPVVNKLFIRNALRNASISYDSFLSSVMPDDKNEIFELFENVKSALSETDDRYIYEIIKEAHIVYVDFSAYMLWNDMSVSGRRIIENKAAGHVLGVRNNTEISADTAIDTSSFVMASKGVSDAINANGNVVITGKLSDNKKKVLSGIVRKEITEGKTVLIACKDKDTVDFVNDILSDEELIDCCLNVDDKTNSQSTASDIVEILDKYKEINQSNIADMPKDLSLSKQKLGEYEEKLNRVHRLGVSVRNALKMYCEANAGMLDVNELYVDEKYIADADETAIENLFDNAARLIVLVKKICKASGMEYHTPLCEHPLYGTVPADLDGQEKYETVIKLTQNICSVLGEYRDLFYDVSKILGIEHNEVNTLDSLIKLNELYDLCISVRDIEITEEFLESDIEKFVSGINRASIINSRCDEIKKELGFFQNEIFEDIDILLSGEKYDENDRGILRKFMHKKNNQDVLLQYVSPENRLAFSSKNISDIYSLLYEYKAYLLEIKNEGYEFDSPLAETALAASALIDAVAGENSFDRGRRISNVFRLISLIPVDSNLARRIAVMKAKMFELVSVDGDIKTVEKLLGADFSSLVFGSGILSFDGMASHLKKIQEKLDIRDKWLKWVDESDKIRNVLPTFVEYVETHGVKKNTEKLFAKSLLLPVFNTVVSDTFEEGEIESIGVLKDKYIELLEKADELSRINCEISHSQSVRHCAQTTSVSDFVQNSDKVFSEFLLKNRNLVSKVKPCFIAVADSVVNVIGKNYDFDTVLVIDDEKSGYRMLPALSYGKRSVILDMTCNNTAQMSVCAIKSGMMNIDTGNISEKSDSSLLSWLNSVAFGEELILSGLTDAQKVELVRINGIFDRTEKFTNKTEAELAVSKAVEALVYDSNAVITVTAATPEQCELVERLAYTMKKKNPLLCEAIRENRFCAIPMNALYKKRFTHLVVSSCFCQDKNGRMGWDGADLHNGNDCGISSAYTYLCENHATNICLISSMSASQSHSLRKTCTDIRVFNSLCEFLYDGRIPVSVLHNDVNNDNSVVQSLIGIVGADKSIMTGCNGMLSYGASMCSESKDLFVFIDGDNGMSMHDELFLKHKVLNGTNVMSLSPASFADENGKQLFEDLFAERITQEVQ